MQNLVPDRRLKGVGFYRSDEPADRTLSVLKSRSKLGRLLLTGDRKHPELSPDLQAFEGYASSAITQPDNALHTRRLRTITIAVTTAVVKSRPLPPALRAVSISFIADLQRDLEKAVGERTFLNSTSDHTLACGRRGEGDGARPAAAKGGNLHQWVGAK